MIISKNNLRGKQLLFGVETRCSAIVAEGIARYKTKQIVMNKLKRETTDPFLLTKFGQMYDKMVKKVTNLRGSARIEAVYSTAKQEFDEIEHLKNQIWRENDQKEKIDSLKYMLNDENNVFFLCSQHADCAKDHEPYQGKLYVSENWESRVKDRKVARYIKRHKFLTVEEVTEDYPYLTTRPNCRHQLKPVSIEAVMSGDWKDEISYVKSQKKNLPYIRYYEKYKYLSELNKVLPNKEANKDLIRTRALMRKHKSSCKIDEKVV